MRPKHVGQPKSSAEDKIRIVLDGLRGDDSVDCESFSNFRQMPFT
jgi:hypothetical protein